MDKTKTKGAVTSTGFMGPLIGLVAFIIQQKTGVTVPVEVQGMVVDLVSVGIAGTFGIGMYGRWIATKVIKGLF